MVATIASLIHDADHPFCTDIYCSTCHDAPELVKKYVQEPVSTWQLTPNQAMALYWGQMSVSEAYALRKIGDWPPFSFSESSDWGRCYTAFLKQLRVKTTHWRYQTTLELFFTTEPRRQPDEYVREDVLTFIHAPGLANGRVGRPPASGTINNRLSCLLSFYHFSQEFGVVSPEDGRIYPLLRTLPPTANIQQVPRSRPPYKALTVEELAAFFNAIGPTTRPDGKPDLRAIRDVCLFKLYFYCARRRSEILDLRLQDIERGVVIDGNTRRESFLYHFRGKGKKGIDDVQEMPEQAATALMEWLRVSGKLEHGQPDWYVFTALPDYVSLHSYDPHRPLHPQTIHHLVKKYSAAAGLNPAHVSCHSFRHSAARIRYSLSGDLRAIQRLLRHSNISTTDAYLAQLAGVADPTAALLSRLNL